MSAQLQVFDTGLGTGRWNTALSAALLALGPKDRAGGLLRFYRFERCVLLGAGQGLDEAVDAGACARGGVAIARRVTGGGAVYMAPSMLAWDVVLPQAGAAETQAASISAALATGLRSLGIAGVSSSPSGISVDGRKISGCATASERGVFLYQGTLLVEDETEAMASALRVPLSILEQTVTSLKCALDRAPPLDVVQTRMVDAIAAASGLAASWVELPASVEGVARSEFAREIGQEAFVRGDDLARPQQVRA